MSKRVALHTLGCKVNQYDSEAITAQFRARGYEVVDFNQTGADVYIINTCTVTNISDHKSRQMIRRAHRNNPEAKIVVVGCLAQTNPDQVKSLPGVNLIIGTDQRSRIVELVEQIALHEQGIVVGDILQVRKFEELNAIAFEGRTRAYLKIQDGCNQYCSYCKVPYARGPSRSRPVASVLEQVADIVKQGYREIVLTGVHLGGYGHDLKPASSLSDIVEQVAAVPGLERLRISSVDPNEIDTRLIALVADNPTVCRHLHIPLQSGSDQILKRMRRRYQTADFRRIVESVRARVPEIAITTDVIVGFPGETPELFDQTYAFLQEMAPSKIHVFQYSPREGTLAASFSDQVPKQEKERRSQALIALSDQMGEAFQRQFVHQVVQVLIERELDGKLVGHTDNYLQVAVPAVQDGDQLIGKIVNARVVSVSTEQVAGILLSDANNKLGVEGGAK
ncbi:MAG TPA: tRNA (N(6)-L-threonylcarbamoyladenosine(37)-C(2))-methylthiotransferase MtaB [Firmicutes bacterium]|nr:tRNA (N(6)-L-threonylcarbamoyladenosine(37)-C(2))-methylthiotransferase MtaB [Bacillota bacterium]